MKKIAVHDDFLEEHVFEKCLEFFEDNFVKNTNIFDDILNHKISEDVAHVNKFKWTKRLVRDSSDIYRVNLSDDDPLFYNIQNRICEKLKYNRVKNISFTYFTQGSHIPWHDDVDHTAGITIYLNEKWDKNDGGIFLFENENIIQGVSPRKNRAIEQVGGVVHSVSRTTSNSEIRKTIQIFV
jgi:hypothetical protein